MTSLDLIARLSRQFGKGLLTSEEFVRELSHSFAGDPKLDTKDAAEVAALIPEEVRGPMLRQIDTALTPTYLRQPFALGPRTKEEELAAARRETARERAWASVLRPLLVNAVQPDATSEGQT